MKDLFRETALGRIIRLTFRGKFLAYDEELNPSTIQKYAPADSESSSRVSLEGGHADPEKGGDSRLVEWAENDPHNPRNWSTPKKLFVTFQICLLTTSVYIGSAIYTAGVQDVAKEFHVSEVAALLGLTLFVVGYALGPMVWVRVSMHLCNQTANSSVPLGSNVGDSLHWSQSCLHRDLICIRPPSARCDIRQELWNASCVSVHHRPCWKPRARHWRCYHRRHVQALQAGLWHRRLGNCSRLRSSHGSSHRWVCSRK